jgi:hypothetical protein
VSDKFQFQTDSHPSGLYYVQISGEGFLNISFSQGKGKGKGKLKQEIPDVPG